ncbi:hypothetical protein KPL78_00120 [Roseomonas sp. HJA6]|uniref:Uncharacterized protein n=1 Tax=Roseomonas alba TaxID=2846776 RepID=A0ABS7A1P4_9PROT|nr:hypothetical protein [Neoroseomonas alba]MBW6396224.1 hypothetical protein [Neoroseomonas alba]
MAPFSRVASGCVDQSVVGVVVGALLPRELRRLPLAEACCEPRRRCDAEALLRLRRWRCAVLRRLLRLEALGVSVEAAAASVPVVRGRLRAASASLNEPRARINPAARRKARNMVMASFWPL